ncbi:MAG: hypothetical protein SVM80_11405, partial [Halobacteriota archaeon]|nr:hypothetical protein [Halobacteriota archaeon]
ENKMATVKEVNDAFVAKGLHIELPYPPDWLVKKVDILEKKDTADTVGVLLALSLINERGKEVSELYYGESAIRRKRKARDIKIEMPAKAELLPLRSVMDFRDEEEAREYIQGAFIHLLKDKGYRVWQKGSTEMLNPSIFSLLEQGVLEIYAKKGGRGFFIRVALRSIQDDAHIKAKGLVELRRGYSNRYDYGLVIPAFQQSIGVKWRDQENWLLSSSEYLSTHRIGVFAVDNIDPNRIYPLTIYTKERELFKYMVNASRHWSVVRGRYLQQRATRESEESKFGA